MLQTIRDRIVQLFVPAVKAGACVPSQGDHCYCRKVAGDFNGPRWYIRDCYGHCRISSIYC